jgi:signal peptidase I
MTENQNKQEIENIEEDVFDLEKNKDSQKASKGFLLFLWETVKVVLICLIIIIPVRRYLFQPFYVKGASMEPNFHDNEYLIINEITYRFNDPTRGDIVVFDHEGSFFIKRIIGMPGEEIEIKDNQIIIYNQESPDGLVLDESTYLPVTTKTIETISKTEVGEDSYYVMGDNRMSSLDSRRFGPVAGDLIVGKTWIRGYPFDKFTIFKTTIYNYE